MICKGCRRDQKLQSSHIVPEWMYKSLYNDKRQFITVSAEMQTPRILQKGIREPLLCTDCEQLLSKLESTAALLFAELDKEEYRTIQVEMPARELRVIKGYDFQTLKRFFLSILWRASISSLDRFSEYQLGPYEEKIRRIVYREVEPTWNDYPILVTRVIVAGKHAGIMATNTRGKHGHKTLYSFTLNGYYITYIVAEGFQSNDELIFLNAKEWVMLDQDYKELGIPSSIQQRMMRPDVRAFYEARK